MSSQYFELITQMIMILSLACICLALWSQLLTLRIPNSKSQISIGGRWLCTSLENPMKREFEIYVLLYSFFWISVFAVVIIQKWYEAFEAKHYFMLCSSLAMPLLLQPIIFPMPTEARLPIYLRYSFKANIWIACYSFIGNYWYTHYFYNVLQAKYTFPSHRLNDVPIALYFATHFYFMTYHTLSNMILRKLTTRYTAGPLRTIFFWMSVIVFAYFTAFMETASISAFPYYSFKDVEMMYTLGSAFYGIYFLVSYPMFFQIDEQVSIAWAYPKSHVDNVKAITENTFDTQEDSLFPKLPFTIVQVFVHCMGCCMIILLLLDFTRISLNIPLSIPGEALYLYNPNN